MNSRALIIKRQILLLIYATLFIGGIIFSRNTVEQYLESKTNYVKTKGLIMTYDLPTITVCYDKSKKSIINGTLKFTAKKVFDLNIQQIEILAMSSFVTAITCKKISLVKKEDEDHKPLLLSISWLSLNMISKGGGKVEYTIFMTSEKNAYGSSFERWYDGKVYPLKFVSGYTYGTRITDVTETNFIGQCSHESYYETLAKEFTAYFTRHNTTCEFKDMCLPVTLPSKIPLCRRETLQQRLTLACYYRALLIKEAEIREDFRNKRHKGEEVVYHSCTIKEYQFEESFRAPLIGLDLKRGPIIQEDNMKIDFRFKVPRSTRAWTHSIHKTIMTEYYIIDDITFIGLIGGTLGLFVGVSFMDVSTQIVNGVISAINCKSKRIQNYRLFKV